MNSLSPADQALLRQAPLFLDLDWESVAALIDQASVAEYPEGGLLFSRGDMADRFFLVLSGRANLLALTEAGNQSIIEVVEAGNTFAEAAIFASGRFPLTAEVAPGTRLLVIPAQPFLRRLADRQGLAAKLVASLARWQRRLMAEVADLKGRTPAQRLGLFLLALSDASLTGEGMAGEAGPGTHPGGQPGERQLDLPLSKSELASRIGITPESLSRAMGRLKPLGVSSHGRRLSIADPVALRRFCGTD